MHKIWVLWLILIYRNLFWKNIFWKCIKGALPTSVKCEFILCMAPLCPPLSSWRQKHDQHITHLQSVANFCYHVIQLCFLNFKTQYWVLSCWFLKQSLELLTTWIHEYEQPYTIQKFHEFSSQSEQVSTVLLIVKTFNISSG